MAGLMEGRGEGEGSEDLASGSGARSQGAEQSGGSGSGLGGRCVGSALDLIKKREVELLEVTELGLASEMEEVELLGVRRRRCGFSGVWRRAEDLWVQGEGADGGVGSRWSEL
ncbi:uncharacterized protein A4U43_C02F13240 [Asparagus officinalis]|uniref:Uncharacterized protein n=1 Tax=Asparagus officinalis TaxID=4686 RepID=A0A5P1FI49_ASPOF|nr:uncharacterized protein A4U43_C02F13240 [Asparagus officinalis]